MWGVTAPEDVVAKLYTLDARRRCQLPGQQAPATDAALVAVWNKTGKAQQISVDPKVLPQGGVPPLRLGRIGARSA